MGREELLYKQAVEGNSHSVTALRSQGAGLEWVDELGKTPLIVACTSPDLLLIAKTLIELGSKVNAYSPGRDGGTPLHHAAKRGLLQTVELLLSRGANLFVRNDDGQTPLDVARKEGNPDIVRAIEGYMCLFSGWLREFYGPGLLEVLVPRLLLRKIWVVIIPSGPSFPMFPQLELVIYSDLLHTKPGRVIDLRWVDIEEPKFQESDPSLIIYDKSNKTQYRFASGNHGDKQQLQWLYDACRGTHQVVSPVLQHKTHITVPSTDNQTTVGPVISVENRQPFVSNNIRSTDANIDNGWGDAADDSSQNGWGLLAGPMTSKVSNGWVDEAPKEEYNGCGSLMGPMTSKASNGWVAEAPKEEYNGWGSFGGPATAEASCNGWRDEPYKEEYNGWGTHGGCTTSEASLNSNGWRDDPPKEDHMDWDTPEHRPSTIQHTETELRPNELLTAVSSVPSAPPLSDEDFDDNPIQYPCPRLDFSPIHISSTYIDKETCRKNETKDGSVSSSSCLICWAALVEAACVPCGHMAACMPCLNEIKSKQGVCPVCRTKIDQVIRIYVS